jgi:hypothetical protein
VSDIGQKEFVMFRYLYVLFYVISGVKYQAKGRSFISHVDASRDAHKKLDELLDMFGVKGDDVITKEGVMIYKDGKPDCLSMWKNAQCPSPLTHGWLS